MNITKAHEGQQKTALETLTEARDILVRLEVGSTPGEWASVHNAMGDQAWIEVPKASDVAFEVDIPDAALIVTLHATLDALIQVLTAAVVNEEHFDGMARVFPGAAKTARQSLHHVAAVALAESVIGAQA